MTRAIDTNFNTFIGTLYASGVVPPVLVIETPLDQKDYHRLTGRIYVLPEDEEAPCPVFGDWGAYYAFYGWLAYRAMSGAGNEFQLMVQDVLANEPWSPETVRWISIINALVNVQDMYDDKFGHYPADPTKFVNSYLRCGEATVLRADRY